MVKSFAAAAVLFFLFAAFPANAVVVCNQQGCSDWKTSKSSETARHRAEGEESGVLQFLPHPPGCPPVKFCACGAAYRIFGRSVRSLWPVSAWWRFKHADPAPLRAGLKRHHMIVLERQIDGDLWLTSDYNSGGHRSRLRVQSIRGYVIVDPQTPSS